MSPRRCTVALYLVASLAAPPATAEETSPYAGRHERPIKALSREQIDDYRAGRGMGLALPAELNGYPGPRHVLDLADELDLTAEQRSRIQTLFDEMRAGAVRLGERIVAGEAALDRLFAEGVATGEAVREAAVELGRLRGELRAWHLGYHLATREALTPHQTARYAELRGYGGASGPGHHGHGRGGHR